MTNAQAKVQAVLKAQEELHEAELLEVANNAIASFQSCLHELRVTPRDEWDVLVDQWLARLGEAQQELAEQAAGLVRR